VKVDRLSAFQEFLDELAQALSRLGIVFDPGPGGYVREGSVEVGRIISWQPGEQVVLQWHPADWQPDERATIELRFEAAREGTAITLILEGLEKLIGDPGNELAGLAALGLASPPSVGRRESPWLSRSRPLGNLHRQPAASAHPALRLLGHALKRICTGAHRPRGTGTEPITKGQLLR
jgi:hypothetical protein